MPMLALWLGPSLFAPSAYTLWSGADGMEQVGGFSGMAVAELRVADDVANGTQVLVWLAGRVSTERHLLGGVERVTLDIELQSDVGAVYPFSVGEPTLVAWLGGGAGPRLVIGQREWAGADRVAGAGGHLELGLRWRAGTVQPSVALRAGAAYFPVRVGRASVDPRWNWNPSHGEAVLLVGVAFDKAGAQPAQRP